MSGDVSSLTPSNPKPAKSESTRIGHVASAVSGHGLGGAMARTATRVAALYLSRPVRLFRPQKMSPWTTLRGLAEQQGTDFSPRFVVNIFRTQGWHIFLHHFLPPIFVNTTMGTVLFSSYTFAHSVLSSRPQLKEHSTAVAALAGAGAGAAHGLVGAPLDNVARYLAGDKSWRQAWGEAFHLSPPPPASTARNPVQASAPHPTSQYPPPTLTEAREAKQWLWEWRHMAGRGWTGWRWGCAKDVTGFTGFFALFDVSRRGANYLARELTPEGYESRNGRRPVLARAAHGLALVGGGVLGGLVYELAARPWDAMRALWVLSKAHAGEKTLLEVGMMGLRDKGVLWFFRAPRRSMIEQRGRWYWRVLPTLGRVGPWGVAFLVWEGIGGTVIGDV
ncbi:hypothetical protein DACRYDRAFT_118645 [Dacryopinax primogenitus]|uniref:Mitochondrial carrier n=1 Tax=Dacryopinax primogenitus (strain DJM 731) TaxID=1858805 RepID=M5FSU5_DACPD|nr:uncharacterized protein DACRYDRAFT_118645 [Dacryopinax primogenitus]EJT98349.1 hypothetical protein DACRYDRAFT_118645 [Dacryopinax primogenitus]